MKKIFLYSIMSALVFNFSYAKEINYQTLINQLKQIEELNINSSKKNEKEIEKMNKKVEFLNLKIAYLQNLQRLKDYKTKIGFIKAIRNLNNGIINIAENDYFYLPYRGKINIGGNSLYEVNKKLYNFLITNFLVIKQYIQSLKIQNAELKNFSYESLKTLAENKVVELNNNKYYTFVLNKDTGLNTNEKNIKNAEYIYISQKDLPFKCVFAKEKVLYLKGF